MSDNIIAPNPDITFSEAKPIVDGWKQENSDLSETGNAAAIQAFKCLATYAGKESADDPVEDSMKDLVADLLHLSDKFGIDMEAVLSSARQSHHAEINNK